MKNFLETLRDVGRHTPWYVVIVLFLAMVGFIDTGNPYLDIASATLIVLAIYGGIVFFWNRFRHRRKPPISTDPPPASNRP